MARKRILEAGIRTASGPQEVSRVRRVSLLTLVSHLMKMKKQLPKCSRCQGLHSCSPNNMLSSESYRMLSGDGREAQRPRGLSMACLRASPH